MTIAPIGVARVESVRGGYTHLFPEHFNTHSVALIDGRYHRLDSDYGYDSDISVEGINPCVL